MLTDRQTAEFCRSMALMLHSGVSLADGVHLLAEGEKELKTLLENMGKAMDIGAPLHTAMAESRAFPPLAVSICETGNNTGRLEPALDYLAKYYSRKETTGQMIKNALAYPCLVMGFMIVVIGILLVKVLPIFKSLYYSLGVELTGISATILALGDMVTAALPVIFAVLTLFFTGFLLYKFNSTFNLAVKLLYLTRFGDKGVSRKFNNSRFSQALAMGLYSGLTLQQSAEMASKTLVHIPSAAKRCADFCADIADFKDAGESLYKNGFMPLNEARLLTIGLQAGTADKVMEGIAERMDGDAQKSLEELVAKIEPAMVVTACLLIGVILMGVMLPLINIMSAMG